MRSIEVDFNTLNSEPVGLVKIAELGTARERELLPLRDGEQVILWEPGLEVDAALVHYGGDYWMAQPDRATWRDLPLSPEKVAELERIP
jgi:hypothetical protein